MMKKKYHFFGLPESFIKQETQVKMNNHYGLQKQTKSLWSKTLINTIPTKDTEEPKKIEKGMKER